ncbi:MAG: Concanavalin A-like lectin/glucanase superfamily [Edaphobacter sp.]|nr:Concanavalin A-like lectin/glucanase superfamily [Edaphobacter sp.]
MRRLIATLLFIFWPGLMLAPAQRSVFFAQNVPVSSSGAITPPPSTNMAVWYKADSLSSSPVATWADSSASGLNLTGVASPTWATSQLNGKPGVTLNGSSQYFTLSSIPSGPPISIYVVFKPTTVGATGAFVASYMGTGELFYGINDSGKQELDVAQSSAIGTSSTTLSAGTWYEGAMTYDGSTAKFYLNGVADGSASGSATFFAGITSIGTSYSGSSLTKGCNCEFAEVLIYNTATYQPSVHTYLLAKYGI